MSRTQINRENHCQNFALTDNGDVETGRPYRPVGERKKPRPKPNYEQMKLEV